MRAWLPSRRSTLHHSGATVAVRSGQVRLVSPTGAYAGYRWVGMALACWGWSWIVRARPCGSVLVIAGAPGARCWSRPTADVECLRDEGAGRSEALVAAAKEEQPAHGGVSVA